MGDQNYRIPDEDLIRQDIAGYLRKLEAKDLLRLLTCGSVDDGKSTLIGRLLYDAKMIYEDQLAAVTRDSKIHGTVGGAFDPALLLDGLKAEREQGITIDVAYRYFSTAKRKFIIADCPGHEQYTRNMATGASTANLAIILVDARNGVVTQTKRHGFICSLLGIKHVAVAINKLDLVGWSEAVYDQIRRDFDAFVPRLNFADIHFFPISALRGDNVVEPSAHMPWYDGATLLHHLENVNIATDRNLIDMRLPVQYVLRPHRDFRGFGGTLASGVIRPGDPVASLPSRRSSRIKAVYVNGEPVAEAFAPMAVTVTLADEIDVSRGDMLAPVNNLPTIGNEFEAMVVWMHPTPAEQGRTYLFKQTTNLVPGVLTDVRYRLDVNNLRKAPGEVDRLLLNEIGRVHLTLHRPLAFDPYDRNRATGAFIVIDRLSNVTVGAGMIIDRAVRARGTGPKSQHIGESRGTVTRRDREAMLDQRGFTVWLTGLPASGKSTIAFAVERQLTEQGRLCYVLDGENVRHGLGRDLGFSADDRAENIRRVAEVAKLMNEAGVIVITAFISPYRQDRAHARDAIGAASFLEVFVDAPLAVCEARDPKGLYRKVHEGEIPQFTGITDPYEAPDRPDLRLVTVERTAEECAAAVVAELRERGVVRTSE